MVIIQARMGPGGDQHGRVSMSIVLDNGDIHHFFALSDGVHHSSTHRFRGSASAAVHRELSRPCAEVVYDDSGPVRFSQQNNPDEARLAG